MTALPREVVPLAPADLLSALGRALRGPDLARDRADREALTDALRRVTGARHAFLFPDGRTALYALLAPLARAHPGAEVLLPDYNFFAVPEMLRRAGLTPVFVDVTSPHGEADLTAAERALTPRSRAVLLGHYFGRPNDLRAWRGFTERRGLELYEDCAHAFGASVDGRAAGLWGRGGFYSLSLTKGLTGVMGGAAFTDDAEVAMTLSSFARSLDELPRAEVARSIASALGGHALLARGAPPLHRAHAALLRGGMDPLDAAMTEPRPARPPYAWPTRAEIPGACAWLALRHLPRAIADIDRQRALARRVVEARPWSRVTLPRWETDRRATGLNLVARVADPWGLRRHLRARGIDARSDYLSSSSGDAERFPASVRLAREGVLLPLRSMRDEADADRLVEALDAWERG